MDWVVAILVYLVPWLVGIGVMVGWTIDGIADTYAKWKGGKDGTARKNVDD